MKTAEKIFREKLPGLQTQEVLAKHTTFKVGGKADYFTMAHSRDEIVQGVLAAKEAGIPWVIFGGASNVIVSDEGFRGLVIKTGGGHVQVDGETVTADAGHNLARLAMVCCDYRLAGFEWGVGIPGTVGGAVFGNAGNFMGECRDHLAQVEILDEQQKPRWLEKNDCQFAYRRSVFQENPWVILQAKFILAHDEQEKIQERMDQLLTYKRQTQVVSFPTSGCMFKNPIMRNEQDYANAEKYHIRDLIRYSQDQDCDLIPARALIEKLDLKGFQIGGVKVSESNANFLLNVGNATAEHVLMMVGVIKQKVRNHFGIQLHEEFRLIH